MNEQITICGHSAQVETSENGNNITFTFNDKTQDGANGLQVKMFRCGTSLATKAWFKAGLTETELPSWWSVAVATPHDVQGYDIPWIRNDYNPTRTIDGKQDFSWIIEATEDNAKRLLEEIAKRAYGSDTSRLEKDKGSNVVEQLATLQRKYRDMKSKHPDAVLLFRCGDFYETYEEDAKTISKILGVTVTHRKKGGDLAGFPAYNLDTYLPKLIRAKLRVAICDQLEPMQPKVIPFIRHHKSFNDPKLSAENEGEYNGYVAIPPTNKLHGLPTIEIEELDKISVHGGVTFSRSVEHNKDVLGDAIFITDKTDIPEDWWIIGFDTKHWGDTAAEWTKEKTIEETMRLAKQLEKLNK